MELTVTREINGGDVQIHVMFGGPDALLISPPANSVVIVPNDDGWNDFGYRTQVSVRVAVDSGATYSGAAYIGFITNSDKEPNGKERLSQILEGVERVTIAAQDSHRFFTMLPSMDAYRSIVSQLGADVAVAVLTAMKDVVALNAFKTKAKWLTQAVESDIFLKSFVRNSESYFAYKNGGTLLQGLEFEDFRKLSNAISIRFQLLGKRNAHEMTFRFDHAATLPKRIAVIIGKNGVGKSQTLGRIVRSALKGDSSLTDGTESGRVLVNRILAFAPTNEAGSVFPSDLRKRPRVWYRRFALNRSGTARKGVGVCDLIVQVARSTERLGTRYRWDILTKALEAIDGCEQICLPTRKANRPYISLFELRRGGELQALENYAALDLRKEPVRVVAGVGYSLSSGEISFLRFASQASLHVENGSLLLLDEPETHLHPNLISKFVSLLDSLLDQTGSAAIIATHSAYFVREVFSDQVTVLRYENDGYVVIEQPTLRTFGADVGAISYFVFGEDEPSLLAAGVEARLLARFDNWDSLYEKYKDELSLELLGSLRDTMERAEDNE